jgi:hypothetical protein
MSKQSRATSIRVSRETRELLRKVEEQLSLSVKSVTVDLAVFTLVAHWRDRAFTIKGEEHATQDR